MAADTGAPRLLVAHVADGESIQLMDVLQTEDGLWLVPEWLELPDERLQTPARAIRLDRLAYQDSGFAGSDLVVTATIPRATLYGPGLPPAGTRFEVVEWPSTRFGWMPFRAVT